MREASPGPGTAPVSSLDPPGLGSGETQDGPAVPRAAWRSPPFDLTELVFVGLGLVYTLSPVRTFVRDLIAFGLVALAIGVFRRRLPPRPPRAEGARAERALFGATLLGALVMLAYGLAQDLAVLNPRTVGVTVAIYLPFALLQQWITLRYMVQRWAGRLTGARSGLATLLGAVAFSLCHLPFPDLVAPTLLSGLGWALAWRAGARLIPIALSHGVLGALLFLTWIQRDPFRSLWT